MTHSSTSLETRLTQKHASVAWSRVRPWDIIRNSSSESDYNHKLDFFTLKLLQRSYEISEVLNCLSDISYKRRNIYLENVPKDHGNIPLVLSTDLFPQRSNAEIKQALNIKWHLIITKSCVISSLAPYSCIKTHPKSRGARAFSKCKDYLWHRSGSFALRFACGGS